NPADVSVSNTDNDTAGITVSPTSGLVTTEAGGTATFTVVLTSQPTANVTIPISSSNTAEGTVSVASLTFTSANWNVAQTVTVTGVNDFIDDGDIAYTAVTAAATSTDGNYSGMNAADVSVTNADDADITYTAVTAAATSTDPLYNTRNAADVSVTNTDNDTAGITVSPTSGLTTTEAGGTATFTVVLNSQPTASVLINLSSSNTSEGTVSPSSVTFTPVNWNIAQTVTFTGVNDFVDNGDIGYTIV